MNPYLLFLTFHRQYDEIFFNSLFFNKSNFLKSNFDVLLHCNNPAFTYDKIKNISSFETNVNIIITNKNCGYRYGGPEATTDTFQLFSNYKYVIQSHPDCYITKTDDLEKTLEKTFDYAVSPVYHVNRMCYSTDFYIVSPKNNIFEQDKNNWNNLPEVPEHYFYDKLKSSNLLVEEINRYENGPPGRHIDNYGIWHEHDNNSVKNFLRI
jgi:hypothetical protein